MKTYQRQAQRGPSGKATIRVNRDDVTVILNKGGESFVLPLDACPPGIRSGKNLQVSFNNNRDKMYGGYPANGAVICKFDHFLAQKDSPPAPKHNSGFRNRKSDGAPYPFDEWRFSAILKIVEGDFEGLEVMASFEYLFREDDEGLAAIDIKGKSGENLITFTELALGMPIDEVEIPYSENVLPDFERMLKEAGQFFQVILKDGWPNDYADIPKSFKKELAEIERKRRLKAKKLKKHKKLRREEPEEDEDDEEVEDVEEDDEEEERPVARKKKLRNRSSDEDDERPARRGPPTAKRHSGIRPIRTR